MTKQDSRVFAQAMTAGHPFVLAQTVKALVHHGEGILLLMKQSGAWDLPGGKLDQHETLDAAIRRELLEETGQDALELTFFGETLRQRENRAPVRVSFYRASFQPGWTTGDIVLSTEHRDLVIADAHLVERLPMLDAYRQAALDGLRSLR